MVNLEGEREFYVKWKGYHRGHNCWEPETNLLDKAMVGRYLGKRPAGSVGGGEVAKRPRLTAPAKRAAAPSTVKRKRQHSQPRIASPADSSGSESNTDDDMPLIGEDYRVRGRCA